MMPPVLFTLKIDGGGLKGWCPYCRKWHIHGDGEGHRIAHCMKETPFKDTGYILSLSIPTKYFSPNRFKK